MPMVAVVQCGSRPQAMGKGREGQGNRGAGALSSARRKGEARQGRSRGETASRGGVARDGGLSDEHC